MKKTKKYLKQTFHLGKIIELFIIMLFFLSLIFLGNYFDDPGEVLKEDLKQLCNSYVYHIGTIDDINICARYRDILITK